MASDRFQDIDDLHKYLSASMPPENNENRCSNSDIDMVNRLLEANGFAGSLEPLKQVRKFRSSSDVHMAR